MDHYRTYTARRLADDPYFRKWVLEPDDTSDHFWQEFLKAYPSREEALFVAYEMVRSVIEIPPVHPLSQKEKAELKFRIYRHLNLPQSRPTLVGQPGTMRRHRLWIGIAASVAITALFALWLLLVNSSGNTVTYSAAIGESKQIWLPDSTLIVLHANSSVTYPEDFKREISLQGEAYFEVTHRDGMPFTVHAGQMGVTVLGTEFHIKARGAEPEVALVSGKVRVDVSGEEEHSMLLAPGDKARLSGRTGRLVRSEADTRLYTAMAQGKWFFDKASLGEIAVLIRDYYGVDVVFVNERQRSLTMSAVIPLTDIQNLANVIARTMDCHIRLTGDKLIIEDLH